jgi:hypothetical protein
MIRNDTSCYVTPIQNWEVRLGMTTIRPACPPRIPTKQLMQSINASSQYTYIHLYSSTDYIVPVIPPLTEINCAVIHRLFSDTSRSVASARSSTDPRRFAARVCSYIES